MVDPLSLAAGIIAVLDLSAKVVKYVKVVKDGSSERTQLLKDIINIQGSLYSLQSHVELSSPEDPWTRAVQELNKPGGPLEIYRAALERLLNKLDPPLYTKKRTVLKRVGSSMSWPFRTEEIVSILATIERQQRLFNLAISLDSMSLNRAIRAEVQDNKMMHRVMTSDMKQATADIRKILEKPRSETEIKILEWLSTMQPQKTHSDISSRRTPGTGEWVKATESFKNWLEDNDTSNVLSCSGIPSSGKTFIASMVIDYLNDFVIDKQSKAAYVYCDYKSPEKDPKQALLRLAAGLLRQFMASEERLPAALIDIYNQTNRSGESLQASRLEDVLITYCNEHSTYIIIDALDEFGHAGGRHLFLKFLKNLEATSTRMFYTTRPGQKDIEKHLRGHPQIHVEASESDIIEFLNQRIDERMEEEEELEELLTSKFREEIISTLVRRAHGMSAGPLYVRQAFCDS